MIKFDIISIFPQIFDSYFNESIIKRALKNKLIKINIHDLRQWATGKHKKACLPKPGCEQACLPKPEGRRQVDDRPYGGGAGMLLMVEPIAKALRALSTKSKIKSSKCRVIMLTPAGKKFTQREAERLSKYDHLILLCGRYEGFDARVDKFIDEKISIGDYVLAGGEIPAMVVMEAVARHIPGVIGHEHALDEETFSKDLDYVEYPQYTRPEIYESQTPNHKSQTLRVPKVLLSGDHKEIREWRQKMAKKKNNKI